MFRQNNAILRERLCSFLSHFIVNMVGDSLNTIKSCNEYIQGLWQYKICIRKNIVICDSSGGSCFESYYFTAGIFAIKSKIMVNINRND
jgi:hypothetical protein